MALTDNLVCYWRLEEASGSRADEVGGRTLTDNNTVTSATGKQGSAAQFVRANSEYLSAASHASLSPGNTDFTFQAWVYLDSEPSGGQMRVIDKYYIGAKEYALLYLQSSDKFGIAFSSDGSSDNVYLETTGTVTTGTWYCVHFWHDSVNNQVGISVNAGTADTTSYSSGVYQGTSEFCIGRTSGPTNFHYWDGRIDEVALWSRVLSGAERTSLYNGGSGLAYGDLAGGGATTRGMAFGSRSKAFNGGRCLQGVLA